MEFTISQYRKLLEALIAQRYVFQTFKEFVEHTESRSIILRHDVDLRPSYSLRFAKIQNEIGITGTYYFRIHTSSYNEAIIKEIKNLGHEIGYHYETMETANGGVDLAYEEFCHNLDLFRKIVPVETICMHGSPRSRFDNKDIWEKYDYRKLGILGDPYFDIDFNEVAYLTDTGRRWNGNRVIIRDKVKSPFNFNFRTTNDIIRSVDQLPDKVMFTFHPQRWTDNPALWAKELVWQNFKNQVKYLTIKKK